MSEPASPSARASQVFAAPPPSAAEPVWAAGAQRTYLARAGALLWSGKFDFLLVTAGSATLDFLRALPLLSAVSSPWWQIVFDWLSSATLMSAATLAGITLAQAAPLRGWRRSAFMVVGGWAGVAVAVALSAAIQPYAAWSVPVREGLAASIANFLMYIGWDYAAIGTAVALYYAAREREVGLARSAREAELAHVEIERSMMESRLAVLRARVEPEFLFGALDEVRGLYARDRATAEALIDALIGYLRAALPQMRGAGSTVGREVALVRAYVAVLQLPRGDQLSVGADVSDGVEDRVLPPMLLLPLVQAAMASSDVAARRRFAIAATETAGQITIDIAVDGGSRPAAWRDDGPETMRRSLRAHYGDEAGLEFASEGGRHRATLRLPADAIVGPRRAPGPAWQ